MANEVIIEEYGPQIYSTKGNLSGAAKPQLITTQVLTIGTKSAKLSDKTVYVVVQSKATAFWYAAGLTGVTAVANTAGNTYVPGDGSKEFPREFGVTDYIQTAADA